MIGRITELSPWAPPRPLQELYGGLGNPTPREGQIVAALARIEASLADLERKIEDLKRAYPGAS